MRRLSLLLLVAAGLGLWSSGAAAESVASTRVIITFRQPPGASQRMLVNDLGGIVRHTYHLVPAVAAELPPGAVASLRAAPGVAMVEEDQLVEAVDTELNDSWGVKRIGAGEVHPTNSGEGVKVAIIDSGIDYNHSDLNGSYAGGYDFVNGDSDPFDDCGHGTLVAGVVAAEDDDSGVVGVAPAAELYALKALSLWPDDRCLGYVSDIIAALDWTAAQDMDVVNMSISVGGYSLGLDTAVGNAYEAGLVLVAAAGNVNPCPGDPAADNVVYPARFDEVIAVAATDQEDERACFSGTGPTVELAAPGLMVWTTYYPGGGYWWVSGTSLATPHVAGAAALVLASGISDANGNGRVNDDTRLWLQETADDLGTTGRDTWYGFGLVDVRSLASPGDDSDGDTIPDAIDNCPLVANASQTDTDGDGAGDACDDDDDNDTVLDATDNCPLVANAGQTDTDGDGLGDACDDDDDDDTVLDVADNCPLVANASQTDTDGDGAGDACDDDDDDDTVLDVADNCPLVANSSQTDTDGDGAGDACDDDDDDDTVLDASDNCPLVVNAGQTDTDDDGAGDVCDDDDDDDTVLDASDNCPLTANSGQADTDGDGAGDACDDDDDDDTIADASDNCPLVANAGQTDTDGDGLGDACDDDDDGDTIADASDNCPLVANAGQTDTDGDGIGDACDTDDIDGDGFTDALESYLGTDPFDDCPDDPLDPAWPLDINNDQALTVAGDSLNFRDHIGAASGEPGWWQRLDLNGDGAITVAGDAILHRGKIGDACS